RGTLKLGYQIMISITRPKARATTAAATLLGAIVLATPLFAASTDSTAATKSPAASSRQEMASTAVTAPGSGTASVDSRIKELHKKLHITDAQKTQWDNLAQVMRDNAQAMVDLQKQRAA